VSKSLELARTFLGKTVTVVFDRPLLSKPLAKATGICIAIVHRLDDNDDKLVVTPEGLKLSDEAVQRAVHFQEQFFKSVIVRK
jgi:hypothetical protein